MKTPGVLQRSLPYLAAILAGSTNGGLIVGGSTSMTDGRDTWLQDFPEGSPWYDLSVGCLFHENAGHRRYTDFGVVETAATTSAFRKEMLNVVEDPRIEREAARKFPGGLRPIADVIEHYRNEGKMTPPRADEHPAQILLGYSLLKMRSELPYQDFLVEAATETAATVESVFGKGLRIKLDALLGQAPTLVSTQDALDLTDAIIGMLKDEQKKDEPSPPNDQSAADGNQGQSGQPGGAGDQSSGEPPPDGPQVSDGAAQAGPDGQGNPQSGGADGGKAEAIAKALAAGSGDVGSFDMFEQAKADLTAAAAAGMANGGLPDLPTVSEGKGAGGGSGDVLVARVGATVGRLKAQLQGLVEASREDDWNYRRSGSRVDPRVMHRLDQGDARVFLSSHERVSPNTAVHLLIDRSGSMKKALPGQPEKQSVDVALEAAMSLSLALEAISGVSVGASAFPGLGKTGVVTLQKHGELVRRAAHRYGVSASGRTPMAEAMLHAAYQLLQDRSPRKMAIVVTDGRPDDSHKVSVMVERCRMSGIEVVGIGIATDSVQSLFPISVVINSVTELRGALFKIARQALTAA